MSPVNLARFVRGRARELRDGAFFGHCAFRVVGFGRGAQPDVRDVRFSAALDHVCQARSPAQEDWEHAFGQRIKGAGVADALLTGQVPDAGHDVVRRPGRGPC